MAKAPVRPAPTSAPKGDDSFDQLAEMLRTLMGSKLGPACPDCGESPCACDDDYDEKDEDAAEAKAAYQPSKGKGPGPFGDMMPKKGMRQISISILMPMHKPGQK